MVPCILIMTSLESQDSIYVNIVFMKSFIRPICCTETLLYRETNHLTKIGLYVCASFGYENASKKAMYTYNFSSCYISIRHSRLFSLLPTMFQLCFRRFSLSSIKDVANHETYIIRVRLDVFFHVP